MPPSQEARRVGDDAETQQPRRSMHLPYRDDVQVTDPLPAFTVTDIAGSVRPLEPATGQGPHNSSGH